MRDSSCPCGALSVPFQSPEGQSEPLMVSGQLLLDSFPQQDSLLRKGMLLVLGGTLGLNVHYSTGWEKKDMYALKQMHILYAGFQAQPSEHPCQMLLNSPVSDHFCLTTSRELRLFNISDIVLSLAISSDSFVLCLKWLCKSKNHIYLPGDLLLL